MTAELILDGRADVARRRLRHPRRVLAALLFVAAALFLLDRLLQQREFDQLTERIASAQGSIDYANAQVNGAIQYGSPQLYMLTTPAGVRTYLRGLVTDAAARGAADVAAADSSVAAVSILPWHRSLIDAREAFDRHAQDWQAFLSTSPSAPAAPDSWSSRLTADRDAASAALLGAAPFGSGDGTAGRVRSIFASGR
jgi:hypothetical protein